MLFVRAFLLLCLATTSLGVIPREANGQIVPLPMTTPALVGRFAGGPVDLPLLVDSADFATIFASATPASFPAEVQARQFFANGGGALHVVRVTDDGSLAEALLGRATDLSGLHALEPLSALRLVIAPELSLVPSGSFAAALASFRAVLEPRRIFLVLDPPPGLGSASELINWVNSFTPADAGFCALYFPYLDVLLDGTPLTVPASGAMAAIYARTDAALGIWRSPAGTSWPLQAQALRPALNTADLDALNTNHISSIRQFAGPGIVPWGARTLDRSNLDNLFISVVRTRGWVAASIERALGFAAIEDNAPPLWSQITTLVQNSLHSLYQQGALVGSTPAQAYFVRCDATTTTAADIAAHRVNLTYGLALIRASEFFVTNLSAATYDSLRPAPVPALDVRRLGVELRLTFPTVAGFNYTLESAATLPANIWEEVIPTVSGDGAWRTPVFPITSAEAFYRLRIESAR